MNSENDSDNSKIHEGWLKGHPQDQEIIQFEVGDSTIETPLFREMSEEEEAAFRQHARDNYDLGSEINPINHPVWKDEARIMNEEAGL